MPFEKHFGSPPAHLDGHHHVHQLPGVREIVVATLRHRYPSAPPYLRVGSETMKNIWRRGIDIRRCLAIGYFGSALRTRATLSGLITNEGFSGIYDWRNERRIPSDLFAGFLQVPGPRMLIMCHPGRSDPELARIDSMTSLRDAKLAVLLGDQWPDLLSKNGLQLGRLVRC